MQLIQPNINNQTVIDYHADLCTRWGYTPTNHIDSGYEQVIPRLRELGKDTWESASEQGREQIEQEVFDLYRNTNRLPIHYYTLEGCKEQLLDLATKKKSIVDQTLTVGSNAGLSFSRFWFENMQEARSLNDKEISLRSRFNNDVKLKRAINLCYKYRNEGTDAVLPQNIRRALELVCGNTIQNFKPMNARAVWEHICPVWGGKLLDFSAGYGGRMLGALTSNMRYHYTGIDPNTKTYNGLVALGELASECGLGGGYQMHHIGSEDFSPMLGQYDAAFSSPPYFNLETYCQEPTQCMNKCATIDAWFELYVMPTLCMLHNALSTGAIYAVNIADYKVGKDQFTILERWKELSRKVGFEYQETINMGLNVRPGTGNNKKQSGLKYEGIYIFKKL